MQKHIIKSIQLILTILLVSTLMASCEMDAIVPMSNVVPDPKAYTLPRAVFMGTTEKISGSFIVAADSNSIYLRPVIDPSGATDVKLTVPFNGIKSWTVSLMIPASGVIPAGRYNLVVKREGKTFLIKRTLAAMSVYVNESFSRDPIIGDEIIVSDCTMDSQGASQYGVGDEIILKGIGFSASDSLYFSATIRSAPSFVTDSNAHFIVPAAATFGTATLKFSNKPIYTLPTGYTPSFKSFAGVVIAKSLIGITGVSLPAAPVTAGSAVLISGVGFAAGDRVVVRENGKSETLSIDETALPKLSFILPATFPGKSIQVLLLRASAPLFSLGFITTDATKQNSFIGNVSMPANIPSGLQGKALSFVINGSGFMSGDLILLGTTVLTTTSINNSSILVNTTAANTAIATYNVKLRRGNLPDQLLGTVNVVTAPRLFEYAQGGIVFWLDPTNPLKGMVCHVKDAVASTSTSDTELTKVIFGVRTSSDGTTLPASSLNKAFGSGAVNTQSIKDIQGVNSTAAFYCDTLKTTMSGVAYGNWYIPSIKELEAMCTVRTSINSAATISGRGGVAFNSQSATTTSTPGKVIISGYMSSSAYTFAHIWSCNFNSTQTNAAFKTNYFRLRAVRSYDLKPI